MTNHKKPRPTRHCNRSSPPTPCSTTQPGEPTTTEKPGHDDIQRADHHSSHRTIRAHTASRPSSPVPSAGTKPLTRPRHKAALSHARRRIHAVSRLSWGHLMPGGFQPTSQHLEPCCVATRTDCPSWARDDQPWPRQARAPYRIACARQSGFCGQTPVRRARARLEGQRGEPVSYCRVVKATRPSVRSLCRAEAATQLAVSCGY